MADESAPTPPPGGQFVVYQTEDGKLKIDVRFEGETVWLTQQHMAELFQTSKQNIGQHLKRIFAEGELSPDSVVKNLFTTAADGKKYATNFYNLDAIISVGYRVKSAVATRFRIWAIFAEGQAMRRVPMHMADWIAKLDSFLKLNDRDILTHAGRISHEMAQAKAELEYDKFKALTAGEPRPVDAAFDRAVKQLPKPARRPRKKKP